MNSTQNLLTWSCELEMLRCRCGHRCHCCCCCFCVCRNVTTHRIACLPFKLPNRWKWYWRSNKRTAEQHITIIETNGSVAVFTSIFQVFSCHTLLYLFVCLFVCYFAYKLVCLFCWSEIRRKFCFPFWRSVYSMPLWLPNQSTFSPQDTLVVFVKIELNSVNVNGARLKCTLCNEWWAARCQNKLSTTKFTNNRSNMWL